MTSSFRLFVELSIYYNVLYVCQRCLPSCRYLVEMSKPPFCRSVEPYLLAKRLSHVVICRKKHFVHQIPWRRKRMYTNCPPAKTFRLFFWRNSHLLSTSVLMPCQLIFIKSKSDNLNSQHKFIITLSPKCHV